MSHPVGLILQLSPTEAGREDFMQPVTEEALKELIEVAKKAGKDTSSLEAQVKDMRTRLADPPAPVLGERQEFETEKGVLVIESTGPARREDFE